MKKTLVALLTLSFSAAATSAITLKTEDDKLSYAIGSDLGRNFKQQGISINVEALSQGMKDAAGDSAKSMMTQDQVRQTLQAFQKKMVMKRMEDYNKQSTANKKEGEAFLAKNKSKPGVKTTVSGLQYKIVKPGQGQSPKADDRVTVEYTGRLINGTVFDSSQKNGKPVTFALNQVIKGWTEALTMMKPGAEWQIYVPSDLAYGPRGVGGPIGPNQTLIFDIKLLSVEKPTPKSKTS